MDNTYKLLLVVDVQNCFLTKELFNDSDIQIANVLDTINQTREITELINESDHVVFTKDYHPTNYESSNDAVRKANGCTNSGHICPKKGDAENATYIANDAGCNESMPLNVRIKKILLKLKDAPDEPGKDDVIKYLNTIKDILIKDVKNNDTSDASDTSKSLSACKSDISYLFAGNEKYLDVYKALTGTESYKYTTGLDAENTSFVSNELTGTTVKTQTSGDEMIKLAEDFPHENKKFSLLTKGEFCNYESCSAFNYHSKLTRDENDVLISEDLENPLNYSTGLAEYINAIEIIGDKQLQITVCGLSGNMCVAKTVHYGCAMKYKVDKDTNIAKASIIFSNKGTRWLENYSGNKYDKAPVFESAVDNNDFAKNDHINFLFEDIKETLRHVRKYDSSIEKLEYDIKFKPRDKVTTTTNDVPVADEIVADEIVADEHVDNGAVDNGAVDNGAVDNGAETGAAEDRAEDVAAETGAAEDRAEDVAAETGAAEDRAEDVAAETRVDVPGAVDNGAEDRAEDVVAVTGAAETGNNGDVNMDGVETGADEDVAAVTGDGDRAAVTGDGETVADGADVPIVETVANVPIVETVADKPVKNYNSFEDGDNHEKEIIEKFRMQASQNNGQQSGGADIFADLTNKIKKSTIKAADQIKTQVVAQATDQTDQLNQGVAQFANQINQGVAQTATQITDSVAKTVNDISAQTIAKFNELVLVASVAVDEQAAELRSTIDKKLNSTDETNKAKINAIKNIVLPQFSNEEFAQINSTFKVPIFHLTNEIVTNITKYTIDNVLSHTEITPLINNVLNAVQDERIRLCVKYFGLDKSNPVVVNLYNLIDNNAVNSSFTALDAPASTDTHINSANNTHIDSANIKLNEYYNKMTAELKNSAQTGGVTVSGVIGMVTGKTKRDEEAAKVAAEEAAAETKKQQAKDIQTIMKNLLPNLSEDKKNILYEIDNEYKAGIESFETDVTKKISTYTANDANLNNNDLLKFTILKKNIKAIIDSIPTAINSLTKKYSELIGGEKYEKLLELQRTSRASSTQASINSERVKKAEKDIIEMTDYKNEVEQTNIEQIKLINGIIETLNIYAENMNKRINDISAQYPSIGGGNNSRYEQKCKKYQRKCEILLEQLGY
jgi:nicotinamidase-related amidase